MDDDDKEPEDEPPGPARDAAQDEGAKLRKVSSEKLRLILEAHAKWLDTGGENGERANLSRTDLRKVNLKKTNLQEANLRGANLKGAFLRGANLKVAFLSDANLQGAFLTGADLSGAQNLTRAQLDEACGDDQTTLPDYLADYQMKPC